MTLAAALRDDSSAAAFFPYLFRRPLILAVLLAAGAWAALSFWGSSLERPPWAMGKGVASVVGRVAGHPVGRPQGDAFPFNVRWVTRAGVGTQRVRGRIWVFRKSPEVPVAWGDALSLWGPLMPLKEGERAWGGISARLFVPAGKSALLRRASPASPFRWASAIRGLFHRAFSRHLSPASADLMAGVTLGDRPPGLSRFGQDFRRSGTYHLLVASGSNVGFALAVWWLVARWMLWWPRKWALIAAPFFAFLYALVAGGDAPVLRAALMSSTILLAGLAGRWDRVEQPLFLSAGIILAVKPAALFEAGFQMSYAATLGIVTAWHVWRRWESVPAYGGGPIRRAGRLVKRWGLGLFLTSFSAQIALAPLLLYYFHRFSWVGIFSNMLAVPLAGLCLALGVGLTALNGLWPGAATLWAVPTEGVARALAGWAHLCARWPGAELYGSISDLQAISLYVGGIGTVALWRRPRWMWVPLLAAVLVLIPRAPEPALRLHWSGGRSGGVAVQTKERLTLFDRGQGTRRIPRGLPVRRVLPFPKKDAGPGQGSWEKVPLAAWATDGRHWVEAGVHWEIYRPGNKKGFAARVAVEDVSALLAFGLTRGQQSALIRRGVSADLLGWTSGGAGPPTDAFLAAVGPRWIVYPSGRLPRSVRRAAHSAGVFRPSSRGLSWRADTHPLAPQIQENW